MVNASDLVRGCFFLNLIQPFGTMYPYWMVNDGFDYLFSRRLEVVVFPVLDILKVFVVVKKKRGVCVCVCERAGEIDR